MAPGRSFNSKPCVVAPSDGLRLEVATKSAKACSIRLMSTDICIRETLSLSTVPRDRSITSELFSTCLMPVPRHRLNSCRNASGG